jgi:hypothetical protein
VRRLRYHNGSNNQYRDALQARLLLRQLWLLHQLQLLILEQLGPLGSSRRYRALRCLHRIVLLVSPLTQVSSQSMFSSSNTPNRCITSRRRRKRGLTPYYGTGWAANHKYGQTGGDGYGQQQAYNPPAPPYSPPAQHPQYTGQTFNSNEGYYGQQSGIELQQPQSAYTGPKGGDPVYAPPPGPPPSKRTGGY